MNFRRISTYNYPAHGLLEKVYNKNLYLINSNLDLLKYNGELDQTIYLSKYIDKDHRRIDLIKTEKYYSIILYNEILIFENFENSLIKKLALNSNGIEFVDVCMISNLIIFTEITTSGCKIFKYNLLKTENPLLVYENRGVIENKGAFGDSIILSNGYRQKFLESRNLTSGELNWQIDVSDIGRYFDGFKNIDGSIMDTDILFINESQFLVQIKGYKLLLIDANDGKILWECETKNLSSSSLSYNDGKIYYIQDWDYQIIDASNGKIIYEKNHQDSWLNNNFGLGKTTSCINNDVIFSAERASGVLAALDLKNGDIIDTFTLENYITGKNKGPLLYDDKVFIIDTTSKLYVFDFK